MKAILLATLSVLVLAGCNDSSQTTGGAGDKPIVSTATAESSKRPTYEQRRKVKAADIVAINKTVEKFYVQEGRFPKDLLELVEKSYLPRLPVLPDRAEWDYDTNSGVVGILKN